MPKNFDENLRELRAEAQGDLEEREVARAWGEFADVLIVAENDILRFRDGGNCGADLKSRIDALLCKIIKFRAELEHPRGTPEGRLWRAVCAGDVDAYLKLLKLIPETLKRDLFFDV
jgi:hypothetical protein